MQPAPSGPFIFFGTTNAHSKCHGNPSHDHPSILAKATNVRVLMSAEKTSGAISQFRCIILFVYRRGQNPATVDIWSSMSVCACKHVCVCAPLSVQECVRLRVLGHSADRSLSAPVAAEREQHQPHLKPQRQEGGEDGSGRPSISATSLRCVPPGQLFSQNENSILQPTSQTTHSLSFSTIPKSANDNENLRQVQAPQEWGLNHPEEIEKH